MNKIEVNAINKKNKTVTMTRVELLWPEREHYIGEDLNNKLFILDEFLNDPSIEM